LSIGPLEVRGELNQAKNSTSVSMHQIMQFKAKIPKLSRNGKSSIIMHTVPAPILSFSPKPVILVTFYLPTSNITKALIIMHLNASLGKNESN